MPVIIIGDTYCPKSNRDITVGDGQLYQPDTAVQMFQCYHQDI